jgi:hypothetical protein
MQDILPAFQFMNRSTLTLTRDRSPKSIRNFAHIASTGYHATKYTFAQDRRPRGASGLRGIGVSTEQ